MKNILFTALLSVTLFACSEEKKVQETPDSSGIHISVNDDSTNANIDIDQNGIEIKSSDGDSANVSINANGINIKSSNGDDAKVQINKDGMDIQTKEGDASVKMDNKGNMKIKSADGKEIEVKVTDPNQK